MKDKLNARRFGSSGDLKLVVHRPGQVWLWRILLVVVCFLIWLVGFKVGGWEARRVPIDLILKEREHLLVQLVQYRHRIGEMEMQLAQRDIEIDILRNSSQKVREDLERLYEERDQFAAQVTQYQRVLKPESGEQGIVLGLLDLTRLTGERVYQYTFDVFQSIDRRKVLGDVKMTLVGDKDGVQKSWDFESLAFEEPLQLKLGFMNYQTLTGAIQVPEGVEPQAVLVEVTISKGKSVNLSRTYTWTEKESSNHVEQGQTGADAD